MAAQAEPLFLSRSQPRLMGMLPARLRAWGDSQTPDSLVSASPRGARARKELGIRQCKRGGGRAQHSGCGTCWNNGAGLGKMRCEFLGYARCDKPVSLLLRLGRVKGGDAPSLHPIVRFGGLWLTQRLCPVEF